MSDVQFNYIGKRVLVIGGASGMGAAAAQIATDLGAEVMVMDVANVTYPVAQSLPVDLKNQSSIDSALAQLSKPVDAIFSCAGVADGTAGIMLINFISQRYILNQLLNSGLLRRGSAVVMISSAAGLSWMNNLEQLKDFLATTDWSDTLEWIDQHEGTDNYMFSKQAMCAFVAMQALPLLQQGIRINSVMPGPTDTPLARANADTWLGFGTDYRKAAGVNALTPQQIGNTLVFLCSEAASGVNGINLLVDYGHISAGSTGAFDDPALQFLS